MTLEQSITDLFLRVYYDAMALKTLYFVTGRHELHGPTSVAIIVEA